MSLMYNCHGIGGADENAITVVHTAHLDFGVRDTTGRRK